MNLEEARVELLSYGYFPTIKNPELRGKFFDLYTSVGVDVCKKCPSLWYPAYQRLKRMNFINIKPMSERKYNFKKGYSIRKKDIVYDNTNLTDELAERLMEEEEDYIPFFEINPKFIVDEVENQDKEDDDTNEIAELRAKYEALTGEKPGGRTKKETLIKKIQEAEAAVND